MLSQPHNTNSSNRFATHVISEITETKRQKHLSVILKKHSGRNSSGRVTTRHQAGRQKRHLRDIDWRRDKLDILAKVVSIEYDPNRSARICLLQYRDGEKRYILAPDGLKVGDSVESGKAVEVKIGNSMPISAIPIGISIHNIELTTGKGAQIARTAGSAALIQSKDKEFANILLPSREVRLVKLSCYATIGQIGNLDWKNISLGKAGRNRHMGVKPTVRGTAQNPHSHPHGGGEGRSGEGMPPKTPWGKSARGTRTRKRHKHSNRYLVKRRS